MKQFLSNVGLVLVLGAGFAMMLGGAQTAWGPKIKANNQAALEAAVFEVVPGAKRTEKIQLGLREIYKCFDGDKHVGWALPANGFGFADKIYLVVGLNIVGDTVTGLKVIKNTETPGLGNRIEEDAWRRQYADLAADAATPIAVQKGKADKSKNEIQAVTGATISSEAVTRIANAVITEVKPQLKAFR